MADSSIDIASRALARLGEPSISAFDEDSDTAEKVNQLYETEVLGLLARYDWDFAKKRVELAEDGSYVPVNEWTRAFLMPTLKTERVGKPLHVYNSTAVGARPCLSFDYEQRWIVSNETVCVIEYIWRVPESQWPGYFEKLAIEALAAALALPVTETRTKDEYHRSVAFGTPGQKGRGGLFAEATEADTAGDTTQTLLDDYDPIAFARFGGF